MLKVLNFTLKSATLSKMKSRTSISMFICRSQSTEKSNPRLKINEASGTEDPQMPKREESERLSQFRNKLKEDMAAIEMNRYNLMTPRENDPLPPWPNNVNPHTGEIGGPRGPEPTRYGDWERKGICVDF